LYQTEDKAFFVYGFAKNKVGNISSDEATQFRKMARYVLDLSDEKIKNLIENGNFEEVMKDEK
jgi:hypothetical protein